MGSGEDNEGSYAEVVSENERRGEGREREREGETDRQTHWP